MSTIERDAVFGVTISPAAGDLSAQADPRPVAFYIQSEVGNSDWVLSRNPDNQVRLAHKTGAIGQLWMREDDPRGGFFLVNAENGQVLNQTRPQGGEVTLEPKRLGNAAMLWSVEPYRGQWSGINAFNDWEQKLNLAGNGPYDESTRVILWEYSNKAPNECWQLIPDTGLIAVESITYDMSQARVSRVEPALCEATSIDNRRGEVTLETSVKLARSVTSSRQFSSSTATSETVRIAEKVGVKLVVEKIVEFSGEMAVERTTGKTTTFGEQSTQTTTVSDEVTVAVKVPPHVRYEYMVRISYGKVSVPYSAQVSRVLPDNTKAYSDISGVYTNVSSTNYDIVAVDVTSGVARPAETLAAPAGAAALPQP